jgi:hypothetical protein
VAKVLDLQASGPAWLEFHRKHVKHKIMVAEGRGDFVELRAFCWYSGLAGPDACKSTFMAPNIRISSKPLVVQPDKCATAQHVVGEPRSGRVSPGLRG